MTRIITADRDRLNVRRKLQIDDRNFLYLGPVKIGQYVPGLNVLQVVNPKRTTSEAGRMVEIRIPDLIEQLSRLID